MKFLIRGTEEVLEHLEEIAQEMMRTVGVSRAEAVARINAKWNGREFLSENELILHELPDYWALAIYYEDVPDWSPNADRSGWTPKPIPSRGSGFWTENGESTA